MEGLTEFLRANYGDGSGSGNGYGSGNGSGFGYGLGDGSGYGDGSGNGFGYGHGIREFNGRVVNMIDNVPTIITAIFGNVARGYILRVDLTLQPCFVVKQDNCFAHGETLREAVNALREKLFEGMSEDERIEAFINEHDLGRKYPNQDLYDWHHRLTGSCDMGRREFAVGHGIDVEHGSMTVEEFIKLTENAYGGDTIKRLKNKYGG